MLHSFDVLTKQYRLSDKCKKSYLSSPKKTIKTDLNHIQVHYHIDTCPSILDHAALHHGHYLIFADAPVKNLETFQENFEPFLLFITMTFHNVN